MEDDELSQFLQARMDARKKVLAGIPADELERVNYFNALFGKMTAQAFLKELQREVNLVDRDATLNDAQKLSVKKRLANVLHRAYFGLLVRMDDFDGHLLHLKVVADPESGFEGELCINPLGDLHECLNQWLDKEAGDTQQHLLDLLC